MSEIEDQDCYFMVDDDPNIAEEQRAMKVLCLKCRDEHYPEVGWLYHGSVDGYGPFDFFCDVCGEVIHKHVEEDESDELTDEQLDRLRNTLLGDK